MRPVFADTSYFIALVIASDDHHDAALSWAQDSHQPLVTTEYVLIETGNFLSPIAWRLRFRDLYQRLTADAAATIVPGSSALFVRGVELFFFPRGSNLVIGRLYFVRRHARRGHHGSARVRQALRASGFRAAAARLRM